MLTAGGGCRLNCGKGGLDGHEGTLCLVEGHVSFSLFVCGFEMWLEWGCVMGDEGMQRADLGVGMSMGSVDWTYVL